jgi:hypothetical protein
MAGFFFFKNLAYRSIYAIMYIHKPSGRLIMSNAKEVADTIIAQFGSYPSMTMIGSKGAVYGTNNGEDHIIFAGNEGDVYVDISFKAKAKMIDSKRPNHLRIIYCYASDTYSMVLYRIHGMKVTSLKTIEGIYGDMLKEVFVNKTGLYLKL